MKLKEHRREEIWLTAFVTAVLLCAQGCSPAARVAPGLPPDVAILPASVGAQTLKQCSRPMPDGVVSYWTPSVENVQEAERALGLLLGKVFTLSEYKRQYVGFVVGDKRLLYVNAFPSHYPEQSKIKWHKVPVVVCDGGSRFWSAEFDPTTKTVTNVIANGDA